MCWPGPSLMNMSNRYQIWPDLGIGVVSSNPSGFGVYSLFKSNLLFLFNRVTSLPYLERGVLSFRFERGSIESGLSRPGPASRIFFITGSPQNRGDSNYIEGTGPLGSSEKGVPRFLTAPRDCLQSGKLLAPMMDTRT